MSEWLRFGVAVVALTASAACSRSAARSPDAAAAATPASAPASATPTLQTLKLTYAAPTVGTDVRVAASDLPAGKNVELTWKTVKGGWFTEDYYHFRGKKYAESSLSLGKFAVDANGRLDARFAIPEDYGGVHDVVASIDGKPVAQSGIEVTQSFEMTPASGPIGTPIELKVKGLGWRTMESTWVVNWDNKLIGFVSAAGTKGSASARFRAAGPAGPASAGRGRRSAARGTASGPYRHRARGRPCRATRRSRGHKPAPGKRRSGCSSPGRR